MKKLKKNYLVLLLVLIFSCSKESSLGNLEGSWTFGSYFVNGQTGIANGELNFVDGAPCTADIWYEIPQDSIANDTVYLQGEFGFRQSEEFLTIVQGTETSHWRRAVNNENKQKFHFQKIVNQIEYEIIFDLVRKRRVFS